MGILFLFGATFLVFATLIEVIVTTMLARGRLDLSRRIDRWSRVVFPVLFAGVTVWAFLMGTI